MFNRRLTRRSTTLRQTTTNSVTLFRTLRYTSL